MRQISTKDFIFVVTTNGLLSGYGRKSDGTLAFLAGFMLNQYNAVAPFMN